MTDARKVAPSASPPPRKRRVTRKVRSLPRLEELPGPFRRSFWRSPIRGPWLTSVFGLILLGGISVMFVTGLLSYAAYNPDLSPLNDQTPGKGLLGFYLFSWPTHPVWLYRLNQGVHVILGLVLRADPAGQAVVGAAETVRAAAGPQRRARPGAAVTVAARRRGGVRVRHRDPEHPAVVRVPGIVLRLHFYGAWVFIAGFVVHMGLKAPRMVRSLRSRSLRGNCGPIPPTPGRSRPATGIWSARPPRRRRSPGAVRSPSPAAARSCCWPCRWASRWAARCAAPPCSHRTARISAMVPATSRST